MPVLSSSFCIRSPRALCYPLIFLSLIFLLLPPTPALSQDDTDTIKLQLKWKHAYQFAGYYAALEMGFYKEVGLDVTILELTSEKSTIESLLDGEVQYAVSSSNIVLRRAQGAPLLALATIFQHSPYAFLVRADSGIEKVEDFSGLRIMMGTRVQDAALAATLRRAGLSQDDYVLVPMNFDALSLVRHETDVFSAYVTDQGFTLEEAGVESRYLLPKHYGVDFYGDVLATTEYEARNHPTRLAAFRDASLKGWDYALKHPHDIIDLILEKYNTQQLSREHLEYEAQASREMIQPLLVKIGYMNPERWQHIKSIFDELGFTEPTQSIDGLIFQDNTETQDWVRWFAAHWILLSSVTIISFISLLLLMLFQMRRQVMKRTSELAESEQHWRALVDAEPACVNTLDRHGRLVSINVPGLAMMEAESFEEIDGLNLLHMIEKEYQRDFQELLNGVFEGRPGTLVFKVLTMKGNTLWIETHAVPFRDSEDKITHLLSVNHDLTQRKIAEAKQDRLQREFNQKHKMVALGQLSGGIAHDFNNILGIITGYTELAMDCSESSDNIKLTKYLKKVEQASNRARALVVQLLAFSRGDAMEEKPLLLQDFIQEDISLSRSTLPSSIEVVTHLEKGLPEVLVDPVQLNQIIMNLSINARDAMGGSGTLTTRLIMSRNPQVECIACHKMIRGDWVELSVSDTGTGIEPAILERLFDPFFTTKEMGKGTGMGLAMIHGIMIRLGGHIVIETQLGKGSKFRLFFPPMKTEDHAGPEKDSATLPIPKGGQRHVLVLDDEPELADYMGDLLVRHDYRVTVTTSGMKALTIFKENPDDFSLLISDQTMPALTGVELAKLCRDIRPGFPIILCTGFSESIDNIGARKIGVGFLKKPVDSSQLMLMARQLIQSDEQ